MLTATMNMRPAKQRWAVLTALPVLAALTLLIIDFLSPPRFSPPGPIVWSRKFGDYEIRIFHEEWSDHDGIFTRLCDKLPSTISHRLRGNRLPGGIEVLRNHKRVYSAYGYDFNVLTVGTNEAAGLDLTGNGIPDIALVDSCWTSRWATFLLFECGPKFKKLSEIGTEASDHPKLEDLDGDGKPELTIENLGWRNAMFEPDPLPIVILRWQDGKYVRAADLMAKPAPPMNELAERAERIRNGVWREHQFVPDELLESVIELLYTGHEDLAWKFIDQAWKPGQAMKQEFIDSVRNTPAFEDKESGLEERF